MRTAIYARYSSDLQSAASIEDQIEVCRRYVEQRGWTIIGTYEDRAISGASIERPGFQAMMADIRHRKFDVVLAESLDRIGRRVADVTAIHDDLSFNGIALHTVATGEVTALLAGILGSVGQQYLLDLKEKTKRGLLGRILDGKSGGGLAFGYRIRSGNVGEREIVDAEATVVRRIFESYANGLSPRKIAMTLNEENIPGPGGRKWSNTTIRGQADRGTGILNNDLYVGLLVWNRCSYIKDPRTGKRLARPNPSEQWERVEVPELRIIDDRLWSRVKDRQRIVRIEMSRDASGNALNRTHRRKYLFSGLLRCGVCGAGYTMIAKDRYGCASHRSKGTCTNALSIKRQTIENRVLSGLKGRLMAPELIATFIKEFTAEINRHAFEAEHDRRTRERELTAVKRKIDAILKAVEDGMYTPSMKERLLAHEECKSELQAALETPSPPPLRIHPNIHKIYERKVADLVNVLNDDSIKAEANEVIRGLVDKVVLTPTPDGSGLDAQLHGDLAEILAFCDTDSLKEKRPGSKEPGSQLSVVAGARNCLNLLLHAPCLISGSTAS